MSKNKSQYVRLKGNMTPSKKVSRTLGIETSLVVSLVELEC